MASIAHIDDERAMCPNCARSWGAGPVCQQCGQVEGLPVGIALTSAGRRLGAYVLDVILLIVTLIIGWLVWSLIVWARGQTPGKQLLGIRCVKTRENTSASWVTMLLREVVYKTLLFGLVVTTVTLGLGYILYFWLLWDKRNQELWDKMAGTIVVDDPRGVLRGEGDHPASEPAPPVVPLPHASDAPKAESSTAAAPTTLGAGGPLLVVVSADGSTARVPLSTETVIGREHADVVVEDGLVSRRHALLRLIQGSVEISDMGSSNGTFVNGARISAPVFLGPDDVATIGTTRLMIEVAPTDPGATVVSDA